MNNSILGIVGDVAITILSTLFFDKTDDCKTPQTQEEIEDLGYAVVVDDEGNEIRNY
jgi:predicted nicotinamide N-methyase